MTLELSITFQKSPIDGITLYEPINVLDLDRLIHSDLLKQTFHNPFVSYPNEETHLKKYREIIQNGKASVNYNKSKTIPFGRSNPDKSLGLHSIRREIRHTLARDTFMDIDIENAHPQFLYQICKKFNIPCNKLELYILQRNQYLEDVKQHYSVDRDVAKKLFLCILYGGGLKRWKDDCKINLEIEDLPFIKEFKNEFKAIAQVICDNNVELFNMVKNHKLEKKETFHNGQVVSYYLQEYECRVLSQLFIYCKENDYIENDVCVLCADGLMIEKRLFKPEILTAFHDLILETVGFDLLFTNKEMKQGYDDVMKHIKFDFVNPTFTTGLIGDYFRIQFGEKFIYVKEQLYYYNGVYWKKDDKKNSTLHNFIDKELYLNLTNKLTGLISFYSLELTKTEDEGKKEDLERKLKNVRDTLNSVQMVRQIKHRKDFVADIINKITNNDIVFDKNPLLFCFNNKVFDLLTCAEAPKNPNDFISQTCGYDYNEFYPKKKVDELDKLLDTIFPNKSVKDYYLTILSTGLYGEQIESLFIANGEGGNGKSLINSLMLKCVGDYGYKLPSTVLLNEIKEGGNPQIANMDCKRFILTQEPDSKRRMCSSTIKELTGDKTLNTRKNYANDCGISLKLTFLMECNDLPKIDEVNDAINRRMKGNIIPFISKFVSQQQYDLLTDKTNIYVGNPYYKSDDFQEKYRQALFMLLLQKFKIFRDNKFKLQKAPEECVKKSNDFLACSDDIFEWFDVIYESDNTNTKLLDIDDVFDEFTQSTFYTNLSKADKRKYTKKYFTEKIKTNLFLSNNFKSRDTSFNGKRLTKPHIINYKKRPVEEKQILNHETDTESDEEINPLDV